MIAWYENSGDPDPTFTKRTITTSADRAQEVYATDVDGDGDTDVLSASEDDHTIAWYENSGGTDPTFTTRKVTTNANHPKSVYATDVDGDGDTDILSASLFGNTVAWYENNGDSDPTFNTRTISTNAENAFSVYATDVDDDGDTDILSASLRDDTIAWYENSGGNDPTFTTQEITTNAENAGSVYATDIDGDIDTDVLSASSQDDKVAWYENLAVPTVVNDDNQGASPPCESSPDANTISGGISQSGDGVLVCAGTYNPQTLDVQKSVATRPGANVNITDQMTLSSGTFDSFQGSLTFATGAALTLGGSSQQTVTSGVGPVTVADLTLDNSNGAVLNSKIDVTGTLTLTSGLLSTGGNLTLTSDEESASARISGSGSGSINGDVTVERYIERKDGNAETSHWRLMASPVGGTIDQQQGGGGGEHGTYTGVPFLSNMWTQGDGVTGANAQDSGSDASVFYYDETASVGTDLTAGWTAVPDLTNPTSGGSIESQEGFAVFLFQDRDFDGSSEGFPITLSATGPVSGAENDGSDVALPVSCTDNDRSGSDGCTDPNDGWNLVANPFVSHVDWNDDGGSGFTKSGLEANAYIYDADDGAYEQTDGTNNGDPFIAPFQAFFVKSDATSGSEGSVDLKVNSNAKADPANSDDREFKSVDAEPLVSLQLSDGNRVEETRVTFREDAEAGKDRYDGYQLTPLSGDYHVLASEIDGRGGTYDSQYRPLPPEDSLTIDLAVTTTSAGTYTIDPDTLANLPTDLQVKVLDTQTGETANLRAGESLSFTVESGATVSSKQKSPRDLLANGPVQKATASGVISSRFDLQIIPGSAIPVELASFNATANKGEADLRWETASETNNAGFVIERRAEGNVWSEIGFVEGAGTTDQSRTYRFTDANIPFEAERVTYRLRQKDLDGTTSLSDETIVELGSPSMAKLHAPFPNPASQQATVRYEVPEGLQSSTLEISVYDVLGRQVHIIESSQAKPGRHERRVSVGDLPTGTYFVRMRAENTTETRRLTIVR